MSTNLPVVLMHSVAAERPAVGYATAGAAGIDLCALLEAPLLLQAGAYAPVPTGIRLALPSGFEAQIRPRSGLAAKHGVTVLNAPGTIDCDYRGEIVVLLINHSKLAYRLESGDRIAQLVVAPVTRVVIDWVENVATLGVTERGLGGFGSTGR